MTCSYYGGITTITRNSGDDILASNGRRRDWDRGDRDAMVREYVRNGRGWSQPNVNGTGNGINTGGRKLPKTPHGAINAMAALQGMLGINQPNLTSMLGGINGSVPNINNGSIQNINNSISNMSGVTQPFGLMSSAVRRLPQVPPGGQMPAAGQLGAGDLAAAGQTADMSGQQSWFNKLFKRNAATPQQQTNQRLQQQLLINQQQSNVNQQQILAGQQSLAMGQPMMTPSTVMTQGPAQFPPIPPPQMGVAPLPGQPLPPSNSVSQLQLLAAAGPAFPHPPPQLAPPPQGQPVKKPGEGWGGRGARLPKVPVPLPSLPPNKSNNYNGSHSFEEVEEDLFLDRIVAVGRGSRRLPNPADAKARPGKRLTRQNGIFTRGYSLDSDEYEAKVNKCVYSG